MMALKSAISSFSANPPPLHRAAGLGARGNIEQANPQLFKNFFCLFRGKVYSIVIQKELAHTKENPHSKGPCQFGVGVDNSRVRSVLAVFVKTKPA